MYWAVLSCGAVYLFIMLYKVVLTFESVDEILKCDYSNESCWTALCCGAVYYVAESVVKIPRERGVLNRCVGREVRLGRSNPTLFKTACSFLRPGLNTSNQKSLSSFVVASALGISANKKGTNSTFCTIFTILIVRASPLNIRIPWKKLAWKPYPIWPHTRVKAM